jgi:hypothetical protein
MTAMSDWFEGELTKQLFRTPTAVADWAVDTVTAVGDRVVATTFNGWIYEATAIAGDFKTHAATEPTWPTTLGGTVVDDQVTWTTYAIGALQRPIYVGLVDSSGSLALLEAGTLTGELSGSGYAREAIFPLDANWSAVSAGRTANVSDIVFTVASGDWNPVVHAFLIDTASGSGNVIVAATLPATKTTLNGETFKINAGDAGNTFA